MEGVAVNAPLSDVTFVAVCWDQTVLHDESSANRLLMPDYRKNARVQDIQIFYKFHSNSNRQQVNWSDSSGRAAAAAVLGSPRANPTAGDRNRAEMRDRKRDARRGVSFPRGTPRARARS
jgi:hypothetical protein